MAESRYDKHTGGGEHRRPDAEQERGHAAERRRGAQRGTVTARGQVVRGRAVAGARTHLGAHIAMRTDRGSRRGVSGRGRRPGTRRAAAGCRRRAGAAGGGAQ
ncbi:MAG TPA: hypothetical protein VIX41_04995, partial [Acidimicrobiales bacterium]